jgi:26 proteasome complex subunit DSS1
MADKKTDTVAQQLPFEEDDEFEEFECDWDPKEEDKEDKKEWEDDWEDDQVDDTFAQQLRKEVEKLQSR